MKGDNRNQITQAALNKFNIFCQRARTFLCPLSKKKNTTITNIFGKFEHFEEQKHIRLCLNRVSY